MPALKLPRWLHPAPDSVIAHEQRLGRSGWAPFVHLAWSVWVFITPAFSEGALGFTWRWALLTLASYPAFLALFVVSASAGRRRAQLAAVGMIVLCLGLLPWYPSGLSYFVFGCVMFQPGGRRWLATYVAALALFNAVLLVSARSVGYPWVSLVWLPLVTVIIGMIVVVDRHNRQQDVALRLSHDEVRRLAALAERERIGRDLHDLLGHTLSMVALKSDLAARLVDRDTAAARGQIDEVSRIAREALAQVRSAVTGIRAAGIAAELASARLLLETDGIAFDYRFDAGFDAGALPPRVETALAMTLREAATNIQRHAGARNASAVFRFDGGDALLAVEDDGRGGVLVPGNGMAGMRERIEAAHGQLRVEARVPGGTRLLARVPLAANGETGGAEPTLG